MISFLVHNDKDKIKDKEFNGQFFLKKSLEMNLFAFHPSHSSFHLYRSSSVFTFNTRFPRKKPTVVIKKRGSPSKRKVHARMSLPKLPTTTLPTNIMEHQKKFELENTHVSPQILEKSFSDLQLLPSLLEAVKTEFKFKKPSLIQSLLIHHALNEKKHLICASETGSGKTMAYLLPIFQLLKLQEEQVIMQCKE